MNEQPGSTESVDLFGAISLGYAVVESQRLSQWQEFCEYGLGLHCEAATDDLLAFRMDRHQRRFIVQRGPAEDFVSLGWQLADTSVLDVLLGRLKRRGIQTEEYSGESADLRGVKRFWRLVGPKGLPIELFVEPLVNDEPLQLKNSAFVTGAGGMGHVAITSRAPEAMRAFWQDIFDARVSDYIEDNIGGANLDLTFMRLNDRHHSIAVAATRGVRIDPIRTKVQHLNLQVASVDDLSRSFMACRELGYEMAHEMGQHPNDHELSFYVLSPSGFEMEIGWNALTVDEEQWKIDTYQGMSSWGHKPERSGALRGLLLNLGNVKRGLASLLRSEYSPLSGKYHHD